MTRPCSVCGLPMDVVEVGRDTHPCCDPAFTPPTTRSRRAAVAFIRAWNRRAYELRSAKHQPTPAYHAARARAGLTRTETQ